MKKYLITIMLVITFLNSFGQKETPNLPIDSVSSKITYSDVVIVDSALHKLELFSIAREWFAKTYKSSINIIQMEEKESGKIVGKALMQVYYKAMGMDCPGGYISYTISIYIKDGKYKYEITNFHHTGNGGQMPDYGLCENMINTKDKVWGISYQKKYNYYLYQLDKNIRELILDLNHYMITETSIAKDDNW